MKLICVVDPMCSWCYGFAHPLAALLAEPRDAGPLELELVMGGLRPWTREPLGAAKADEIFGHWHRVAEASGQPFAVAPHTALHEPGFVYDTEPACRAVVTVRSLWPQHAWPYLEAVQRAFYAEARNVTRAEVLGGLAEGEGLPRAEFDAAFDSDAMRAATRSDFERTQQWGIGGFPALIAEHEGGLHLVANGFLPLELLRERLASLATAAG